MNSILRKKGRGLKGQWTLDEIKTGINHFKSVNGHYPRAQDFNEADYLPTARLIERNFGGLPKFREMLNLPMQSDLTKGEYRSNIAKKRQNEARIYEEKFYGFLTSVLPELNVHEHKVVRPGNVCCDFFVYTSDSSGFVIDLFYAQDINSVRGVVDYKIKRYKNVTHKTYLVLVNNLQVTQTSIDSLLSRKKKGIPQNIKIYTEKSFKIFLKLNIPNHTRAIVGNQTDTN